MGYDRFAFASPKKKKKEKKEKCESVFRNKDSCPLTDYLVVSRVYPVTGDSMYTGVYRGQATYYRELKSLIGVYRYILDLLRKHYRGSTLITTLSNFDFFV